MDDKETLEYRTPQPGMSPTQKRLLWGLIALSVVLGMMILA